MRFSINASCIAEKTSNKKQFKYAETDSGKKIMQTPIL